LAKQEPEGRPTTFEFAQYIVGIRPANAYSDLMNVRASSASEFLVKVLVSAILGTLGAAGPMCADDATLTLAEPQENLQPEPSASPAPLPQSICEVLTAAAVANDLPAEFFTRLIWQESRFRPEAVSHAGAQGVAQFMPGTARMRGLADPFEPREAIVKSAELLRDLNREFGNLGLAAAAYNAGPGRVRDWLGGRRALPGETQAYVRIVTGRSAEEWAGRQKALAEMPVVKAVPCTQGLGFPLPISQATAEKVEVVKPWGVEVAGGPTRDKAIARYREVQSKYAAILTGLEPLLVIKGIIGDMGAVHARVGADTRAEGDKLCAKLRAAGWYCDVLRN
jgi:soluble lytic murein transglycosylase-like protein